ncbi:MAG: stress response serine/threonine protein kinase YihE [Desulfobulbaceae bacterium A2]|nr:MAG: stress response serine/threonine protein kinase YihE [Desulfobulbaceae bacterium A2]
MKKIRPTGSDPVASPFLALGPETMLNLVERSLDTRLTNLCRPLASYINRVCELQCADGRRLVVKFYRPGRWSHQALRDEHDFLLELAGQEIPVIAPLALRDGNTLGDFQGIFFAVFPWCGGRNIDEYSEEQWLEIGRLLGRIHAVGAVRPAPGRITMHPENSTRQQADFIVNGGFIPPEHVQRFRTLLDTLIGEIAPLFGTTELLRIHGDCHFANLIHRPGESLYLIDFDDMVRGPAVQDFWMLLPGTPEECALEIDLLLEGYETFRRFDRRELTLIEPLRAMRFIHYMAWCAWQQAEEGLSRVAPDFGTTDYWQRELDDLADQITRIRDLPPPQGNW